MASSKAGNKERKLRREAGITQGGGASRGKAKKAKSASGRRVSDPNVELNPEAKLLTGQTVRERTEEPLPMSDISPEMGRSPDASTGLSDTTNTGSVGTDLADILDSSGAAFDDAARSVRDIEEGNVVVVRDNKGKAIPQYSTGYLLSAKTKLPPEERNRRNALTEERTTRRQTKLAKSAKNMPVTSKQAAKSQAERLEDVDLSDKGVERAQVLGRPVMKAPRVVTADPPQAGIRFQKDKQGKIRSSAVPRGNPAQPKPVSRTDTALRRRATEAQKALEMSEAVQELDSYRGGLTRAERADTGRQNDVRLAPVADENVSPQVQSTAGQYIDQGSAVGGQLVYDETNFNRSVTRGEALANSNNPLNRQQRSYFRRLNSPAARSGAVTKLDPNTRGSSMISNQFRANVQALAEASDATRIKAGETGVIDEQGNINYTDTAGNVVQTSPVETYGGLPLKDALDSPTKFNTVLGRVRKNKRNTEIDPFSRRGNSERTMSSVTEDMEADLENLGTGGTPSERAASFIAAAPNSVKAAERSAMVFTGSGGELATGSVDKPTETTIMRPYKDASGLESTRSLREEVQENWAPYRDKLKSVAAATDRPLDSLTVDDAIRQYGIQEGTRRDNTKEMESFPGRRAGQSALRYRKSITDPATGKSVSGRGINAAVANVRVNTQGAAAPTDDELARMRATQPRLANVLSRLPGSAGALVASVVNPHQLGWHGPIHPDDQSRIDEAYARGTQKVNYPGFGEVEAGIGTVESQKTDAVRAYPASERGEIPGSVNADFKVPGGTASRKVIVNPIPEVKGTGSAGARVDRDYAKKTLVTEALGSDTTPWVTSSGEHMGGYGPVYAPHQNIARTTVPAVIAGRDTTSFTGSGAYFDPTAVVATRQNLQRAAARPTRRAGIAAARSVAETRRREANPMPKPAVREEITTLPDNNPVRVAALAQLDADTARRNTDAAARKAKEAQEKFDKDKAAGIGFQNWPAAMLVRSPDAGRRVPTGGPGQPFSPEGPTGPAVTTNSTDIAQRMGTMPIPMPRPATRNTPPPPPAMSFGTPVRRRRGSQP